MKDRLKVQISKRFKKQLTARFSALNSRLSIDKAYYTINIPCPLCKEYRKVTKFRLYSSRVDRDYSCNSCPFDKFSVSKRPGCVDWINQVSVVWLINFSDNLVTWRKRDNRFVKDLLRELKVNAKKHIEWV